MHVAELDLETLKELAKLYFGDDFIDVIKTKQPLDELADWLVMIECDSLEDYRHKVLGFKSMLSKEGWSELLGKIAVICINILFIID